MAKETKTQRIIKLLLSKGSTEIILSKSKKYKQFTINGRPGMYFWVGKSGAVRVGKNPSKSISITHKFSDI